MLKAINELEFNGEVVGYRAVYPQNKMFDISLQAAQQFHLYPKVSGVRVKLKQRDGLIASASEIENGIYAEDLSTNESKAHYYFLRRDTNTGWPIVLMKTMVKPNHVYLLDVSYNGSFALAKVKIVGQNIHWTDISTSEYTSSTYFDDFYKMSLACLYDKHSDIFIDKKTTVFSLACLDGDLSKTSVTAKFYDMYESWATESSDVVVNVYDPNEYKALYKEPSDFQKS
jgi:hypothetical protein